MLVQDFLQLSAERHPQKTALICADRRLTYAEIESAANRLAHTLIAAGVQRGDRVVIFLPNSVETVIAIFGVLKAAGIFTVINYTTKREKLAYILNNCQATGLITTKRKATLATELWDELPTLKFTVITGTGTVSDARVRQYAFENFLRYLSDERPACPTIDLDLACLIYTSGSTGEPKGVMAGHNNIVFASGSIITYLENVPSDIIINVLPLSFDYGLYQLLMTFRFGGTLVLEKSFAFPVTILKRMEAERVTGFPGVPTMFAILLQMDLSGYDLSSLRYLTNTAAALPPAHIRSLQSKFSGATLYSMYGLTECKRTLYLPPGQLDQRPGSVGIAIPGTEVWLEDETGQRVPPDAVGELVIRGSHVMRGYWADPAATARTYRPGPTPGERLLYSGDYFKMDEDGYLYFVGRKDDMIKSRGEKVPPKEIETVLYGIAGVAQAAVIGIPDPLLGQAIKAFIAVEGVSLTAKEVLRHCREHLEDFMVPQQVVFRDRLPVSENGKIMKKALE